MWMVVEGSLDLPVVVAIPFEDVPQEHQFNLYALFITESSGPVNQSRPSVRWQLNTKMVKEMEDKS
jgi:hypothetical protein